MKGKKVLDVGAGDINGNNRHLFTDCEYHGNDVYQAPNVTIVCKTSQLPFVDDHFDTIVSSECFEHDPEYSKSFQAIVRMLRPGGLFFFTCATEGRNEHGTRRTTPHDSYGTIAGVHEFIDHYKNITLKDLDDAVDLAGTFSSYAAYVNHASCDLYFWGIKKTNDFTDDNVVRIA
jgi:SAM-dependent methyltransferase